MRFPTAFRLYLCCIPLLMVETGILGENTEWPKVPDKLYHISSTPHLRFSVDIKDIVYSIAECSNDHR